MKTIGLRLTLLYVLTIGGMIFGVLLLGRFFLENHLVHGLDANLRLHYSQLKDRLGSDTEPDDVQSLLAATGITSDLTVTVQDLWDDPAYRDARSRGLPAPSTTDLKISTVTRPDGTTARTIEGLNESIRILLALPMAPVQEALGGYTRLGLIIAVITLGLSFVAGRLLSRAALRPVHLIERTAAHISSENLSERIPVGEVRDEISNLALLLNKTFDRLESSFLQVKQFAADASHELKTPLSLVRLNLERAVLNDSLSAHDRESLQDAIEEIHRMDRLIENLLFLSRAEAGEVVLQRKPVDAHAFIEHFVHDAQVLAEAAGVRLRVQSNASGLVNIEAARIRQVLLNLVSNAVKFSSPSGSIDLSSSFQDGLWCVAVTDEGPGVPRENLSGIFGRFVRIAPQGAEHRPAHTGSGLGLAISRSIIELHGGRISASNRSPPGKQGLSVEFVLPRMV